MTAAVRSELEGVRTDIIALSKAGKYGEAVRLITKTLKDNVYLMSTDGDDVRDFICGWIAGDACCNCCDSCSNNGCVGRYCLAFIACFFCCGSDTASQCCGCDWAISESSTCCREQCC